MSENIEGQKRGKERSRYKHNNEFEHKKLRSHVLFFYWAKAKYVKFTVKSMLRMLRIHAREGTILRESDVHQKHQNESHRRDSRVIKKI